MSRANSDEQFHFLISCIRHSNNGKASSHPHTDWTQVDFAEVAKECNIVSKGAAAKRYERMMKAHGINPNGGPSPSSPGPSSASTSPAKGKGAGAAGGETTANNSSKDSKDGNDSNNSNSKKGGNKQSPGKRKAASAGNNSKKAKALTSAEKIAVNVNTNVKEEKEGTDTENADQNQNQDHHPALGRRNHDPLLSEAAGININGQVHPDEAALFKEFCNTGESARAGAGGFEVVAPSNVNVKREGEDEDEDADADGDDDVTFMEQPESVIA